MNTAERQLFIDEAAIWVARGHAGDAPPPDPATAPIPGRKLPGATTRVRLPQGAAQA